MFRHRSRQLDRSGEPIRRQALVRPALVRPVLVRPALVRPALVRAALPRRPALVLALLAGVACHESGPPQVRENAFTWQGTLEPGATIYVREMRGGIEVVPSASDTVKVTTRTEWRRGEPAEDLDYSASEDSTGVLLCVVWGRGSCDREDYTTNSNVGRGRGTDAKVFFRIEVPAGVRLDLLTMDGNITTASSAPVDVRVLNGDIVVATAVGPVHAETLNGDVDIRMSSVVGTDSIVATTMNGDAYVYIPDGIDVALDMSTATGTASTHFAVRGEVQGRKVSGVLGAGTHPVHIRSINGDVALRRLDAQGRSARP